MDYGTVGLFVNEHAAVLVAGASAAVLLALVLGLTWRLRARQREVGYLRSRLEGGYALPGATLEELGPVKFVPLTPPDPVATARNAEGEFPMHVMTARPSVVTAASPTVEIELPTRGLVHGGLTVSYEEIRLPVPIILAKAAQRRELTLLERMAQGQEKVERDFNAAMEEDREAWPYSRDNA